MALVATSYFTLSQEKDGLNFKLTLWEVEDLHPDQKHALNTKFKDMGYVPAGLIHEFVDQVNGRVSTEYCGKIVNGSPMAPKSVLDPICHNLL
jgi:hypothetical protein